MSCRPTMACGARSHMQIRWPVKDRASLTLKLLNVGELVTPSPLGVASLLLLLLSDRSVKTALSTRQR